MPSERVKVESFPELARLVGHELSVEVPAAALEVLRGDRGFAHLEEAEREAAVIFAALTHPSWRPATELSTDAAIREPAAQVDSATSATGAAARIGQWLWRGAVLLLLAWIACSTAHCQNNSFLVQGLDGSGNVLGTFPSVLRIKPSANCSTSVLGSVLTIGCLASVTNDAQVKRSEMGVASGVATLDGAGKIPSAQMPALAIINTYVVASEAAQLALSVQQGDVVIRSDLSQTFIQNGGTSGTMADWTEIQGPPGTVQSVNGYTGAVSLNIGDVMGAASWMGTATIATSSCGTSPSITGTDHIGTVVEGAAATGCTVSFSATHSTAKCVVSSSTGLLFTYSVASTGITITNVGAFGVDGGTGGISISTPATGTVTYICEP